MTRRFLACLLMCAGCGDGNDTDGTPSKCDVVEDRMGTYLFRYRERSGDCGPIPEQLGRIDNSGPLPDGCSFTAPDVIRNNGCTLERSYACLENEGVTSDWVAITTQEDAAGARISGIITVRISDGVASCTGTYDLTASRQ